MSNDIDAALMLHSGASSDKAGLLALSTLTDL